MKLVVLYRVNNRRDRQDRVIVPEEGNIEGNSVLSSAPNRIAAKAKHPNCLQDLQTFAFSASRFITLSDRCWKAAPTAYAVQRRPPWHNASHIGDKTNSNTTANKLNCVFQKS